MGEYGAPGLVLVMLGIVIASQFRDKARKPHPCEGLHAEIARLSSQMAGFEDGTTARLQTIGNEVTSIGRDLMHMNRDVEAIRNRVSA
jgi:hypothetical protein